MEKQIVLPVLLQEVEILANYRVSFSRGKWLKAMYLNNRSDFWWKSNWSKMRFTGKNQWKHLSVS